MSERANGDMAIEAPNDDIELWADEEDEEPRRRGWFGRRKAKAHEAWRKYLDTNIPAEDDGDESLPSFLRGHRGRMVFSAATVLLLCGWALAVAAVVF